MTQVKIEFKSAGPTRSGRQIQIRFKVAGKMRSWTLYPKTAALVGGNSVLLHAQAKQPEAQRLCARALAEAARVDPTDVRDAAARAKAERAPAAWARSALDHGMTDERLRVSAYMREYFERKRRAGGSV